MIENVLPSGSWIFWLHGECQEYGVHVLVVFKSCLWISNDLYSHAKVTCKTIFKSTLFALTSQGFYQLTNRDEKGLVEILTLICYAKKSGDHGLLLQ